MDNRGDFIDLAPTEHVDAHITRLKRRASKLVANNQQACYPVLVEQQRKWWKRYKREHKRWAYICVDRGHKRHDLFISSDGLIGTGKLYPTRAVRASPMCASTKVFGTGQIWKPSSPG